MMVVYVPGSPIFVRGFFAECFGDLGGSRCNWVVPNTWPEWTL